jgi:hypothetical protein
VNTLRSYRARTLVPVTRAQSSTTIALDQWGTSWVKLTSGTETVACSDGAEFRNHVPPTWSDTYARLVSKGPKHPGHTEALQIEGATNRSATNNARSLLLRMEPDMTPNRVSTHALRCAPVDAGTRPRAAAS